MKFLEFDEKSAEKYIEPLIADESGAVSYIDVIKFTQGARYQHQQDKIIMEGLLEIVKLQREVIIKSECELFRFNCDAPLYLTTCSRPVYLSCRETLAKTTELLNQIKGE